MKRSSIKLFVAVLLVLVQSAGYCDEVNFDISVHCSPSENKVVIVPDVVVNGVSETPEISDLSSPHDFFDKGTCTWKNGTAVFVQESTTATNDAIWISVWVNEAKLVSEMPVLGLQYEVSLVSLKIDESGAKLCTRKTDNWGGAGGGENKEPLVCKYISVAKMPKAIDRNEFPKH